jgi:hypothetical protein
MALNPKFMVTVTVEELEAIKDAATMRAEEMEWQLRIELARLREVERNLARIVGEPVQMPLAKGTPVNGMTPVRPASAHANTSAVRRLPPPPPRYVARA